MSDQSIRKAFEKGKAFIPFITCGDPDLATTAELVRRFAADGAAIIELGIPFSDPTAEGPVIQEANIRSLTAGTTTDDVFALVRMLRDGDEDHKPVACPLVIMTYANVVYHYGIEEFCTNASEVGIDGLILPDVPYEEKEEFAVICQKHGFALISMIAPTSDERIAMIAHDAEGFIYLVSSMGVTGMRSSFTVDLGSIVEKIRAVTDTPIAIGFGVSNAQQAHDMAALADGVIMGSAIVRQIGELGIDAPQVVGPFVKEMVVASRP